MSCCSYNPIKLDLDVIENNLYLYSFLQLQKLFACRLFQFQTSWKCCYRIFQRSQTKKPGKRCNLLQKLWKVVLYRLDSHWQTKKFPKIVGTKLSEFHKITVTALKIYFKRQDLRVIHYRDYKKFNTKGFRQDFFASLHKENVDINHKKSFWTSSKKSSEVHAPIKKELHKGKSRPIYE